MNYPFSDENKKSTLNQKKNRLREPSNFFLRDALAFALGFFQIQRFSWKNQFKYFNILLPILDDKISKKYI